MKKLCWEFKLNCIRDYFVCNASRARIADVIIISIIAATVTTNLEFVTVPAER